MITIKFYYFDMDVEKDIYICTLYNLASNPFKVGDEVNFQNRDVSSIKLLREFKFIEDNKITIEYKCQLRTETGVYSRIG